MSDSEEWRPIKGHEGLYEVSSHGRVRRLFRIGPTGTWLRQKMIKPSIGNGYPFVGIRDKENNTKVYRVHKLVACAFLGLRPEGLVINHIDYDKTNNHVSNLEYVTTKENIHHSAKCARHSGVLSMEEVQALRSLVSRDPGIDLSIIAKRLGVDILTVRNVLNATTYTLVPNKDGSMPTPITSVYNKPIAVEDVEDFLTLGFTIPQISKYYRVDYSTPYQMLRRAGIWQVHSKSSTRGSGRRAAKLKAIQATT